MEHNRHRESLVRRYPVVVVGRNALLLGLSVETVSSVYTQLTGRSVKMRIDLLYERMS
jgi:hypothetical protein